MRSAIIIAVSVLIALIGAGAATQYLAHVFAYQPALAEPWLRSGAGALYAPWAVFEWTERWSDRFPKPFAVARLIVLAGFATSILVAALALRQRLQLKPFGKDAWANFADIEAAGLFAKQGAILGRFQTLQESLRQVCLIH